VAGGLAVLWLAGCGGGGRVTSVNSADPGGAPGPTATVIHHRRAAVRAPAGPSRPVPVPPALSHLRAALERSLRRAGPSSGASVYDLSAQDSLFVSEDGVQRPPASVEKLYTTIALLNTLGPDARLHTTVLGSGHLGPGGVWHGNLYLRGSGDPTFGDGGFNRVWELGYGPTAVQLAGQLRSREIRSVTGRLIGDESLFDERRGGPATGFAADIPDFGGQLSALTYDHGSTAGALSPGAFAARQLARTLHAMGVRVSAAAVAARTPHDAHKLAVVSSPPLSVLLKLMDVPSDDLFAELLTKQLGVRFSSAGTTAAGASVIHHEITEYGVHPAIVDGSGLSRADGSSPREVVDLLRSVWETPTGDALRDSLPIVGETGTVRTIATRTAAEGHCVAKTGTLNYVTNLAGYCHVHSGHTVAFALFIDGPSNQQALVLLGRMLAAIARY
jgi:serine-type D-Ala-D-Ala carboxypeptidase/endopeptidase (penicillin-binding protein 4)